MDALVLCCEREDGDIFDLEIDLPDDLMIRLMWWIDVHDWTLTC